MISNNRLTNSGLGMTCVSPQNGSIPVYPPMQTGSMPILPPVDKCGSTESFGNMFNKTNSMFFTSLNPLPMLLESAGPIRNMTFTPGALKNMLPGVYKITYTLSVGESDYGFYSVAEPVSEKKPAANSAPYGMEPMLSIFDIYAEAVAGVMLNGVVLPSSLTYMPEICCGARTIHGSTMVELPANTVINVGIWTGDMEMGMPMVLLPNSELSAMLIGSPTGMGGFVAG